MVAPADLLQCLTRVIIQESVFDAMVAKLVEEGGHYMHTTWVSVPIKEDRPSDQELFGSFCDPAWEDGNFTATA